MSLLLGALGMGSVLALLALGIFVSFRIFAFPDMTAEGSVTLGAAVAAALLVAGHDPVTATAAATAAGAVAGTVTGVLHTRFRLNGLLAGILVMTALYSINLHIMGRSNLPLGEAQSFDPMRALPIMTATCSSWGVPPRRRIWACSSVRRSSPAWCARRCTCSSTRASDRRCVPPATTRR
jgi:ABC-type uncharacterized transport system permease subunit